MMEKILQKKISTSRTPLFRFKSFLLQEVKLFSHPPRDDVRKIVKSKIQRNGFHSTNPSKHPSKNVEKNLKKSALEITHRTFNFQIMKKRCEKLFQIKFQSSSSSYRAIQGLKRTLKLTKKINDIDNLTSFEVILGKLQV